MSYICFEVATEWEGRIKIVVGKMQEQKSKTKQNKSQCLAFMTNEKTVKKFLSKK